MRKILVSLSIIGVVAAIAIGGTIAYFSDVETSSGNTFTAGKLDLKVNSECHFKGKVCEYNPLYGKWFWNKDPNQGECHCSWGPTDVTDQIFFDFSDLKPGDWGESTISLHVHDNKAWACAKIDNVEDLENNCNEPELEVPDQTCGEEIDQGELSQYINMAFWYDKDCDNVYEPPTESPIYGPLPVSYLPGNWIPITDSTTNTPPLEPNQIYCIGVAWCVGTMNIDPSTGEINCDGSSVGNIIQTDSLRGDISFYIEQWRNNPNFKCNPPTIPPPGGPPEK
jgi:predicted ribosomally synthesized peptide with SipW-like signal peptide